MTITYPQLSRAGRLGNQLWEIAATIGIATFHETEPQFPRWDYQPYFCLPDRYFVDEPLGTPATELVPHMDPRASTYLQDVSLFANVEDTVRAFLQPSQIAQERLDAELWFTGLSGPKISVHVRRGDNVTHPKGFHPLRSMDYYREALKVLPDGNVIVFSDDPDWCEENIEFQLGRQCEIFHGTPRPREYLDRQAYMDAPILDWIDLQLMARCDYHVLSNSTYAWWGAWLSPNRRPIYPTNWFGREIRDWTDASLMFPAGWKQVLDETQGGV